MVDSETNGTIWIPKNLSYEGSYHQKYYYPRLVSQNKMERNASGRSTKIERSPDLVPGLDFESSLPGDRSCVRSDSDTTFSEDYTTMTEDGESDIDFRASPGSIDDFSDGSSHSTIGNGEDNDCADSDENLCGYFNEVLNKSVDVNKIHHNAKQMPNEISLTVNYDSDQELRDPVPSPTDEDEENESKPIWEVPNVDINTESTKQKEEVGAKQKLVDGAGDGSITERGFSFDDEDGEFEFLTKPKVQRSTSLKTYKTPPGTPHRKKAVRFADALGLDLESVRHILNRETPPNIPNSALRDLRIGLEDAHKSEGSRYLTACFSQPGGNTNFLRRVRAENVVLENCLVDDRAMTITGTVRVNNMAYHKCVIVRYSTDTWITHRDVHTNYVPQSNDGPTDRFSFTIHAPYTFSVGSRLDFAVMYTAGGQTFWDNNNGTNYTVECYARAMPTSDGTDASWTHFL